VPIFIAGKLDAIADIHLSDIFVKQIIKNISSMIAILFGLLALAIFVTISYLIHGSVINPLDQIIKAYASLRRGIWDEKIEIKQKKDEIGEMLSSFQYMRDSLRKAFDELKEEQKTSKRSEEDVKEANIRIKEERKNLEEKNVELKKFYDMMIGRELKMIELKKEIKDLKDKLNSKK